MNYWRILFVGHVIDTLAVVGDEHKMNSCCMERH